ncbi:hypothetical protein AAG906_011326 [Vitis piasezkii]
MLRSLTLLRLACSCDHHIREPLLTHRLDHMHRGPRDTFEKLRDAGVIVPLAPRPLPHPIPPHFRSHEHCLYHQIPGHDTEHCSALHHAIQDLIDSGVVDLARPSVTTNPLPAHSTHAFLPPGLSRDFRGVAMTMLDGCQSLIHTLFLLIRCDHSFIITLRVGTPRFGTHDIFTHCISCTRGMGIGMAIPDSTFIGDTVTLLDTLHWDTLYSSMPIWRAFSLEHSHPIWILYTGACPSFGGRSDWFLTLEHLPDDMEIIGLFHIVLIAYWGIAT